MKPRFIICLSFGLIGSGLASFSSADELYWTQPYSGQMVYGPLAGPGFGELPNCPECQCEACEAERHCGFIKRLFRSTCDKLRWGRREYYFCKQTHHTMYTPPVLPPYCDPGYGYYEADWRRHPPTLIPCDPVLGYPVEGLSVELPAAPAPATVPHPEAQQKDQPDSGKAPSKPTDAPPKAPYEPESPPATPENKMTRFWNPVLPEKNQPFGVAIQPR